MNECLDKVDIIFLSVNTPIKISKSNQESFCFDIKYIEDCARNIADYFDNIDLKRNITIIEKSTVPVSTSKHILEIL